MTITHFQKLADCVEQGNISSELAVVIHNFFQSYGEAIKENDYQIEELQPILKTYVDLIVEQLQQPFVFEAYHHRVMKPFDYYHYGLDLLRPLVVFEKSKINGLDRVQEMEAALAKGENVILFANHQTEPDPQAISLLLEKTNPKFAEEMIFVAGNRVIDDPLAAPISKGRNLICIFSKRHLENPPEKKQDKLRHNQRAMKKLTELLGEGGKCIYVAPSGGRDRPNASGEIEVAQLDPQSIEMFWLIAQQAEKPCHFYPLALATYSLLPPPNSIEKALGEQRYTHCTPIHMAFGEKIDMVNFPGSDNPDKKLRRQIRAQFIWKQIVSDYQKLTH